MTRHKATSNICPRCGLYRFTVSSADPATVPCAECRTVPTPPTPPQWSGGALCAQVDPEFWFPGSGQPSRSTKAAKAICQQCGIRDECLSYALSLDENPQGIWGATTRHERKTMKQWRKAA